MRTYLDKIVIKNPQDSEFRFFWIIKLCKAAQTKTQYNVMTKKKKKAQN
jgi:hypothetical protein